MENHYDNLGRKCAWRHVFILTMLFMGLSAQANVGDRWMAYALVTPTDDLYCNFEVVSEADATVKIISREDEGYLNTLGGVQDVQAFWIKNEVTHEGKTYRIVGIGKRAFKGLTSLQEVSYMGDNIEFIEEEAFRDCDNLLAVHLPEGLKTIGAQAFRNCVALYCTNDNGSYDSYMKLPSTLRRIESQAFQRCLALEDVYFNDGLEYIGRWGFAGCTKLSNVELPSSVDVYGGVFAYCTHVTDISSKYSGGDTKTFSEDGVLFRYLDDDKCELAAFPGGRGGEYVIPDFCASLGDYCFDCTPITAVTIPSTVKSIGKNAFIDNLNLVSVYTEWIQPEDIPTGVLPFGCQGEAPYRTLYIPNEGYNASSSDIAQTYQNSIWNDWFDNMSSYTVGNVYGLRVAGWPVQRTKVKNISFPAIKDGRVSYDLATKTLTLEDAVIQTSQNDDWGVGNNGIRGLIIKLIGENEFNCNSAGIYASENTHIEGPGSLNITSNYEEAIRLEYWDLYINNTSLYLDSRGGAISGDGYPYVNVTNSYLFMTPTYATGVATVNGIAQFNVNDCYIDQPVFGMLNENNICNWKGDPSYGYVVVKPGNSFGFYIESDAVTDRNYTSIVPEGLKEGTISYDPDNNELTLNNVRHFSNNSFLSSERGGLTVKVVGDNYINTTEDCFWLLDDIFIQGNGKLTTDVDMGVAVKLDRDYTWLYCNYADLTLNGVGGAIYGDASNEAQGVTFSYADVKLSSNGKYQVTKNLDYMELENCQFADSRYFFDEGSKCICDATFYGDPVYKGTIVIVSDEKPTGISQYPSSPITHHPTPVYDLQGRRVSGTPQKGIFIQNGRKVVVK